MIRCSIECKYNENKKCLKEEEIEFYNTGEGFCCNLYEESEESLKSRYIITKEIIN